MTDKTPATQDAIAAHYAAYAAYAVTQADLDAARAACADAYAAADPAAINNAHAAYDDAHAAYDVAQADLDAAYDAARTACADADPAAINNAHATNGADDPCCGLRIGDRVIELNTSTDDNNPPAQGTVVALHADRESVTVDFSGTDVEIDLEDVIPVGGW